MLLLSNTRVRAVPWLAAIAVMFVLSAAPAGAQLPLDPMSLTKYMDALPVPGAMPAAGTNYYEIGMYQVEQQLHSQLPATRVWGYGTSQATASYPGATIEAQCNVPIDVLWTNHLPQEHLLGYAIDYTLHMVGYHDGLPTGEWTSGVPACVHVHGAEVEPQSDGGPNSWFTQEWAETGSGFTKQTLHYANTQLPTTLWYHDHALGITRLNVYAGLAGFYVLRDPAIEASLNLPDGPYEIPMAIQDRMFFDDGQLLYPVGGDNPEIHPIWQPEFFGNVILVNGKVWPYLNVEPRKYRFRILDGSNARFYSMQLLEDATNMPGPGFWQIGSDGGYLDSPVLLADPANPNARRLLMGPGERCDVIVDFSGYSPGTTFTLRNYAKSPFPNGEVVDPQTTGQIMQFRVVPLTGPDNSSIATPGPGYVEKLADATVTRTMTLDEVEGPEGPVMAMLNNTAWDDPVSELPTVGSTEVWRIVNTTGDAHPIHLHLTQFQLLGRQRYQVGRYMRAYMGGGPGAPAPDPTPYLIGRPQPVPPEESGWKDTFKMWPGEVTTVIVRFGPQRSAGSEFAFDATAEPGYVWHCHILEHEDNEMMRPYKLQAPLAPLSAMAPALEGVDATPVEAAPMLACASNPVVGRADIRFRLAQAGPASVRVYGVDGRLVKVLTQGEFPAGSHAVSWGTDDENGARVPSGIYFLLVESAGQRTTSRIVLAR